MHPKYITLSSTHLLGQPLSLPAPNGFRAAIEAAVLQGQDLSFRMIEGDLTGAHLEGIRAISATFVGSLEHAKLSGGVFTRASFQGSLMNAKAEGADFAQANLNGVDLTDLNANRADFRSASLRGANCVRMSARDALFDAAQFERAQTDQMDVEGATVFKAKITPEQLQAMATPFEDIMYHARNGTTRSRAASSLADAIDNSHRAWASICGTTQTK